MTSRRDSSNGTCKPNPPRSFLILRPWEGMLVQGPKTLAHEYVLAHFSDLTEQQVLLIRDEIATCARAYGIHNVHAFADQFTEGQEGLHVCWTSKAKQMKSVTEGKPSSDPLPRWPYELARLAHSMATIFQEENAQKKRTRRKGRPTKYDRDEDQRIFDAWRTGNYRKYADLARERGKNETVNDIKKAIDRVRPRHR